ncbi:MAG: tetratricopeptide repeat protein [Burkholderiaceae bacterium]
MRAWSSLLLAIPLCAFLGCATAPLPRIEGLLHDELFAPPSKRIAASDAMTATPAMKRYLAEHIGSRAHSDDRQNRLVDLLYRDGELKLDYEAAFTRNAAEAFEARSGNCLSLVMMTGVLARELGLTVRYQQVRVDNIWERSGDMVFSIGHVNLTLSERGSSGLLGVESSLQIDFQPPRRTSSLRYRVFGESTLIAMYLNNRAAESLSRGQRDDAYWWAREALRSDPTYTPAYNTLGVIYRKHGQPALAEAALNVALASEPENPGTMSNLLFALRDQGRAGEAEALAGRLARLEPNPPYSFFNQGMAALSAGHVTAARDLFEREVRRAPYNAEFHLWLATVYARLGDLSRAQSHLAEAIANSPTRGERELYTAKLARLKAGQAH